MKVQFGFVKKINETVNNFAALEKKSEIFFSAAVNWWSDIERHIFRTKVREFIERNIHG